MKRLLQIGNVIALGFALIMNLLTGAQLIGLPAINDISDKYATPLTPAAYAFSIWSLIYVLLIIFVIYQARDIRTLDKKNDLPTKIGPWFIIASICNGLWTFIFVKDLVLLSVIVLLLLTASLYIIINRLRIALDNAPIKTIAYVWWPILIYTGWVFVATIVNIASWLKSVGTEINPIIACATLVIVGIVLLAQLATRNVRELLLASTWGMFAIGVQQHPIDTAVSMTAFGVSGALIIAVIIHGYKNRQSNPFYLLLPKRKNIQ